VIPINEDGDGGGGGLGPEFALSTWGAEGGEEVEILVHVPDHPSEHHPASLALLYGLAILVLDQNGTLSRTIDTLTEDPISEAEACRRIDFLLKKDANDRAA
jgi:hypothetical protein